MPARIVPHLFLVISFVSSVTASAIEPARDTAGASEPITAPEVYGEGVRSTPWLSPADELAGFHLPPGFEIRLFASEPQIAKPLNMAFDDRGRLWVTHSVEYPYPATDDAKARDAVSVLQDTDGDGTADQVQTFADGLNIPIGVLPYGEGCLCFSIPNIWYLRDTDGDGKCDKREVVLGPFDTSRDTHGMVNSLRDIGDGWIYACHGFNNQSRVAGADGHVVTLNSGNTFRFRPDGSRIEHYTRGQVNPFGMTVDEWGYLYTADCHSKPITQLIRGACYPSFGRPDDGLGFLPPMVDHLHGSTAISGIVFIPPDSSVVPLREQFISGNVMTSRLNRNRRVFRGATAIGEEMTDFLTSDDPWFRPVDIQLGPDGHLYVADFYNKIIGHYEVPLEHPERDRTSGRIWQIRYVSSEFSEHVPTSSARPDQRDGAHAHSMRVKAESLGRHGQPEDITRLLGQLADVPKDDPVLRQTIRIAVRDLLDRLPGDDEVWSKALGNQAISSELASILLGVQRPQASAALLRFLAESPHATNRNAMLSHAASHVDSASLGQCVDVARKLGGSDRSTQFELLGVLCESQNVRPDNVPSSLRQWALQLVDAELTDIDTTKESVGWFSDDGIDWPQEQRPTQDASEARITSSFGRGETYTGRWVSDDFAAPDQIEFWIAGHNGFPSQADHGKNSVRLLLAQTGETLYEIAPPRSDTAVPIRWDTKLVAGQDVRIECIDGDSGDAYAWLGIGKFKPAWVESAAIGNSLAIALEWIERLGLNEKTGMLEAMLRTGGLSSRWQTEVARALASLRHDPEAAVTLQWILQTNAPLDATRAAIDATIKNDRSGLLEVIKQRCKSLSTAQQRDFALAWASSGASIETLLDMAQSGWISRKVLVDPVASQAIGARLTQAQQTRLQQLTASVESDHELSEVLAGLKATLVARPGSRSQADRDNGHQLFTKHCAACHQLHGEGAVVGPQLDGAMTRSAERLLEDIVTPDQNVDEAFRTTSFVLDDGRVIVGLVTAENDDEITVVAANGKPTKFDSDTVELRREAGRSLMPGNMAEILSADDFADLIHFLQGK